MTNEGSEKRMTQVVRGKNYSLDDQNQAWIECPNCEHPHGINRFAEGMPCAGCEETLAVFVTTEDSDG